MRGLKLRQATPEERQLAQDGLQEMDFSRLSVVLIDAPRPMFSGHKIRVVESKNPIWDQWLCQARPRSASIRSSVARSLKRIERGLIDTRSSSIDEEILAAIREYQEECKENFYYT